MAILKHFKKNKLTEDLHIDGATFIGSAYGFDVYDVKTWAAAEQFALSEVSSRDGADISTAGTAFLRSEQIFNRHINETIKLYLFVEEGTNKTHLAAIRHDNQAHIRFAGKFEIIIPTYLFETVAGAEKETAICDIDKVYPLYLLPEHDYNGHDGLIIDDRIVKGTYNGLVDPNNIPEEVKLTDIIKIKASAFEGYIVPNVVIEDTVRKIERNAFYNYTGAIKCASEEPNNPDSNPEYIFTADWDSNWKGNNTNITWGIYLTPEEIARREEEKRAREEAERREREFQAADAVTVLRYKEEGNGITILGVKRRRKEIEIPAEINGKPVTKVAQFAFYDNQDLKRVVLPNTVREIGKAAFANCNNCTVYYPKEATVYRDAFQNCGAVRQ